MKRSPLLAALIVLAAQTPAHAQLSPQTREGLAALADRLQSTWNPDCASAAGRAAAVRVTFAIAETGELAGPVYTYGAETSDDPGLRLAAARAIIAVQRAAPFTNLPREAYGQRVTVNFNAREACGG